MSPRSPFDPLVIRASAGTGKTYALSTRYLGLIMRGEEPHKILATTFTRKAAGEIRERIFQRLARAASDAHAAETLANDTGVEGFGCSRAKELLQKLIQQQHRMQICTLDSFFIQIATVFALELGLGSEWSIADTPALDQLKEQTLRELCFSEDSEQMLATLRSLAQGDVKRSVHQRLMQEIGALLALFQESDREAWEWLQAPAHLSSDSLTSALQRLLDCEVPTTKSGSPHQGWVKALTKCHMLASSGFWKDFMKSGLVEKVLANEKFYKQEIPQEVQQAFAPLIQEAGAELLGNLAHRISAAYHLLEVFSQRFSHFKIQSSTLEFNDVKHILARGALLQQLEHIYYRLDSRISHILLDEFQDTSLGEWIILQPIVDEILSFADQEHTFFCVGDLKQAIYGWRGGVAEIFDSLNERWEQLQNEELNKSYRSSPIVLDFANRLFLSLESNQALQSYPDLAREWQEKFSTHDSALTELDGRVEVVRLQKGEDAENLEQLAQRVSELCATYPQANIGVLVRSNKQVSLILREFSKEQYSIQASGEGGNPLSDSSAVLAFLSFLRLVDHSADSYAAYHLSVSPLGPLLGFENYADPAKIEQIVSEARASIFEIGLGAYLRSLAASVSEFYTDRDRRRLEQFVDLAYEVEPGLGVRMRPFIDRVNKTPVPDIISEQVRVMTVHQSKGLEFDIVLCMDFGESYLANQARGQLVLRDNPLSAPQRISPYVGEEVRLLSPELQEMAEYTNLAKLREEIAVLYVAITRARQALYVFTQTTGKTNPYPLSMSGIIHACFSEDDNTTPATVFEQGSKAPILSPRDAEEKEVTALPAKIKLQETVGSRQRGLPRLTASGSSAAGHQTISEILSPESNVALQYGTKVHALFEQIEWLDKETQPIVDSRGADERTLDRFYDLCKQENVRAVLSRNRYQNFDAAQVFLEFPFAIREEEGVLSGVIDRLVICKDPEGRVVYAEVIDFKTDTAGSSASLQDYSKTYASQMNAYRSAVTKMFELEPGAVSCHLLYVSLDACVVMEPESHE